MNNKADSRSKAQSDVDALSDELVLLSDSNRAFRQDVRNHSIHLNWNGKRLYCVLCEHSWPVDGLEAHDPKCPLWQSSYGPAATDVRGKRA